MARPVQRPSKPKTSDHMQPRREPLRPESMDINFSWTVAEEPHKNLTATVRRLLQDQQPRLWNNTRLMSLYANQDLLSGAHSRSRRVDMPRQTLNPAKIYGDTLAGKLVQSNSRVTCLSSGGDWKKFRLARKLDRALEAEFRRGRLYEVASQIAIDAINTGTAYLHMYECEGKVCYERWFPNEVFIDELDAAYGEPTVMFRTRFIKRQNALALWPDRAEVIEKAPAARPPTFGWTMYQTGMIQIYEGWALPVGNRPGRHTLCLESGWLINEPYKAKNFPVAIFKAGNLPFGWYGQGLLEQAAATQVQINRILNIMAKSAELGIAPFWVLSGGGEISTEQLSNVEGHVMRTTGPPPQWVTNPPFHPAAIPYVDFLLNNFSIMYGINDIEGAASKGFNRVDSDPALSTMQDMWMARHMIMLKNWSDFFFLDVAERTVDLAKQIAKRRGNYPVQTERRGQGEVLDWADFLELEKDEYTLQMSAMNFLPSTPEAKYRKIVQMKAEGLLSIEEAQQYLSGPPDLDYLTAIVNAVGNDTDRVIDELMEGKIPIPYGVQDLEQTVPRVQAAALVAIGKDAPAKIISAFESWIAAATMQIQQKNSAAIAAAGGMADGSFGPDGSGLGGSPAGQLGSAGPAGGAGAGGAVAPLAPTGPLSPV